MGFKFIGKLNIYKIFQNNFQVRSLETFVFVFVIIWSVYVLDEISGNRLLLWGWTDLGVIPGYLLP